MAQRSSLVMNLLRILTPEEINDLTTSNQGDRRISLTSIAQDELFGEKAKILPFNADHTGQNKELKVHDEMVKMLEKYLTVEESDDDSELEKINEQKATSCLILDEKKKFEKVTKLSKSRELFELYKKNSSINIQREKKMRDDLERSSRKGVLVNKKQA